MKRLSLAVMALLALAATPAFAAVEVLPVQVRSGYFAAPDCTPTADPKVFNECICQANIKKAEIKGPSAEIVTAINQQLALLPEKLADESCEGTAAEAPTNGLKVNQASADFEVAYQTPATLTMLITYSTYGAGADHPLDGAEGFTFDLTTGKLVDPIAALKPEQLKKADAYIKQELLKKYPAALFDEAKARTDPYLTENGCDTCTLFYGKDGWMVRFQLDTVAPYMTGEPEVAVPADIIPPPEKLTVKG